MRLFLIDERRGLETKLFKRSAHNSVKLNRPAPLLIFILFPEKRLDVLRENFRDIIQCRQYLY